METKAQRIANFYMFAERYGLDMETADKLRRIEMTLHRWAEAECNGEIQRDDPDDTVSCAPNCASRVPCGECTCDRADRLGKPRFYYGPQMDKSYPIADREAGALKRLAKIMEGLPHLVAYHQTDPRGCALYVIPKDKIAGRPLDQIYLSCGFGVSY